MNRDLAPSALGIEGDRRQVIVRREEPQATASRGSSMLFGLGKQSSRDTLRSSSESKRTTSHSPARMS
jgi:hypothetical protein